MTAATPLALLSKPEIFLIMASAFSVVVFSKMEAISSISDIPWSTGDWEHEERIVTVATSGKIAVKADLFIFVCIRRGGAVQAVLRASLSAWRQGEMPFLGWDYR